ncbi:TPA: hypothetical protein ACH3X2_000784 [Trebouxia sp. C0005]
MEARLNLAEKQAPAVAALGHTQGRVAPHRGGFAPARPARNNTPYARGNGWQPANTAYPRGNTFGRGTAFGRTSSQQSFTPTRGANSQPVVSRGAFNNRVAGPTGGRGLRCAFCHKLGHSAEECKTIERALDFRNGRQQASTFLDSYCTANNISVDGSQYLHDAVFDSMDMSDMLASYDTSQPQSMAQHMLDIAAAHTGLPVNLLAAGMANALSSSGPKMMFNVELAVSLSEHFQARALVDTGATHSYISQKYLASTKLPMQASNT